MGLEEDILSKYKTVAVVGLSSNPERPSHRVARYLKEQGYRIIPVNPRETEVLGEKAYPDLCAAAARARRDGIAVVMDRCMMKEHRRIMKKGR
jgi:predicted CoA-binding protein